MHYRIKRVWLGVGSIGVLAVTILGFRDTVQPSGTASETVPAPAPTAMQDYNSTISMLQQEASELDEQLKTLETQNKDAVVREQRDEKNLQNLQKQAEKLASKK